MIWETMIYTAIVLLGLIVAWEALRSKAFAEGFTDGVGDFISFIQSKTYSALSITNNHQGAKMQFLAAFSYLGNTVYTNDLLD